MLRSNWASGRNGAEGRGIEPEASDTRAVARNKHTSGAPGRGAEALTVDQLARAGGTTTRQVRALQSHGLLPHPRIVGRTGYYDNEHLERLRPVLRLQAEGFSLPPLPPLIRPCQPGP